MKLLLKSAAYFRRHQASDPARISLKGIIEHIVNRSRQILRVFVRRKQDDISGRQYRYQYRLPEVVEDFSCSKQLSIQIPPPRLFRQRSAFFQKVTTRWASNSIAATLRRDTAKQLMFGGTSGPLLAFIGFTLAKKPTLLTEQEEMEGVCHEIREVFSHLPWHPVYKDENDSQHSEASISSPVTCEDLTIGNLLAKGCNAAVYTAHWKHPLDYTNYCTVPVREMSVEHEAIPQKFETPVHERQNICSKATEGPTSQVHQVCIQRQLFLAWVQPKQINFRTSCPITNGRNYDRFYVPDSDLSTSHSLPSLLEGSFTPYNLAVKMMFNYNAESNASAIWRAMHKESIPALKDFYFSKVLSFQHRQHRKLPPHPNIVEMYCAFADQVPLLPEAHTSYPQALPMRLADDGYGRNMTLFLVMKRYHCSLQEYLKTHQLSTQTSLLLLTQLLEGVVHLLQNDIAHRDLKTDNILVDLTYGMWNIRTLHRDYSLDVLTQEFQHYNLDILSLQKTRWTDKGVSNPGLAITDFGCCLEGLKLSYTTEEIDKGGNLALMAPEVVTAKTGPFATIDYSRSDLWTVGTLAYEIFGINNPFYEKTALHLDSATYKESELPALPPTVPSAIQNLIKDMLQKDPRMRPSPSLAATICQVLLHAPSELLTETDIEKNHKRVVEWMVTMSALTFCQAAVQQTRMSSIELQLRYTFCSRIQFPELLEALHYITSR